jgi:hypothetical protein
MGSMLQGSPVTLDDFDGHEGCNEVLNVTRPDTVRSIHDGYLDAGVDCLTTNTFGANLGNLGNLGEYGRVRDELGTGREDPADLDGLLKVKYRGCRYSFGYPACPDLEDRATVMRLLRPERIGVTLSEEFQLAPEQSTDALIAHHPEARYFST